MCADYYNKLLLEITGIHPGILILRLFLPAAMEARRYLLQSIIYAGRKIVSLSSRFVGRDFAPMAIDPSPGRAPGES
jgi:hypothetical protein